MPPAEEKDINTMIIKLNLTIREIQLLRNSTSDLGIGEGASLQLKIANAILDTATPQELEQIREKVCHQFLHKA